MACLLPFPLPLPRFPHPLLPLLSLFFSLLLGADFILRLVELALGVTNFLFLENYCFRFGFLRGYLLALMGNIEKLRVTMSSSRAGAASNLYDSFVSDLIAFLFHRHILLLSPSAFRFVLSYSSFCFSSPFFLLFVTPFILSPPLVLEEPLSRQRTLCPTNNRLSPPS